LNNQQAFGTGMTGSKPSIQPTTVVNDADNNLMAYLKKKNAYNYYG
jgi:hypothetical protein